MSDEQKMTEVDQSSTFQHLITLYQLYRDYMKHEDDLLNHRTTWLLVIQGFLFATLGVTGEWIFPNGTTDLLSTERKFLVYVLVAVGMVIAVAALISIRAANDAIDTLQEKWDGMREQYPGWKLLPEIAGGGHPTAKERGKQPALWIPVVILVAWLAVAGLATKDKFYPPREEMHPVSNTSLPGLR